jgi:hypothetical protein
MTQYDNTNRGVLFDNERKQSDNHPDMTGKLNVNGVDHWFSAWWKEGKNGQFLSLSLGKEVEAQGQQGQQRQQQPQGRPQSNRPQPRSAPPQQRGRPQPAGGGFDNVDDDIPW